MKQKVNTIIIIITIVILVMTTILKLVNHQVNLMKKKLFQIIH